MLWTILPKSSARAWLGPPARIKLATTKAVVRFNLVVVIGVLFLRGSLVLVFVFVLRGTGVILLVLVFVLPAIFIRNSEMALEQAELVDVDVAHEVDYGQLAGFGNQDHQPGDIVALLHHVDLVVFA